MNQWKTGWLALLKRLETITYHYQGVNVLFSCASARTTENVVRAATVQAHYQMDPLAGNHDWLLADSLWDDGVP